MPTTFGELMAAGGDQLRLLQSHRLGNSTDEELRSLLPAFDHLLVELQRLSTVGREWERTRTASDLDWHATSDAFTTGLSWARLSIGAALFEYEGAPARSEATQKVDRAAELYGTAADLLSVAYREPTIDAFLGPTGPPRREITTTLAAHLRPLARTLAEWSSITRGSPDAASASRADGTHEAAIAVSNACDIVARTEARCGSPTPTLDMQAAGSRLQPGEQWEAAPIDRAVAAADRLLRRAGEVRVGRWSLGGHTPSVLAGQAVACSIAMDVSARLLVALAPVLTDGPGDGRNTQLGAAALAARSSQTAWAEVRRSWQGVRTAWEAPATAAARHDACDLAGQMGRAVFADPGWQLPPGPRDRLRDVCEFREDPEALAHLLHGLQSVSVSIAGLADAHKSMAHRLASEGQLMVPTRRLSAKRDEPRAYAQPDKATYADIDLAYEGAARTTRRTAVAMTPLSDLLAPGGTRSNSLVRLRLNDRALTNLQRNHLDDRECRDQGLEIA